MKRIFCGISGTDRIHTPKKWADFDLEKPWPEILSVLKPGDNPRPIQSLALNDYRILETRKNLIVSAPTNSGKTLISLFILLDTVRKGKRAVLLEPLRALAREKADELAMLSESLGNVLGTAFKVSLSTGDYRLDNESYSDPPPNQGEVIIATPERLESIYRSPENQKWIESIGSVCVDEAHLITSSKRGPLLECLITSFLCQKSPPRIALLSATLGDAEKAVQWLSPCDVIKVTERYPSLRKEVFALEKDEDANKALISSLAEIHENPTSQSMIFVYQTKSAEKLAEEISGTLGEIVGEEKAKAYHMQMSLNQREAVREAFKNGLSRCLVTTTGLGLGVNLPSTHVIIRDTTFYGSGALSTTELIQMMGRAGRGNQPGYAAVILRANDTWNSLELSNAIQKEELPGFLSYYDLNKDRGESWNKRDNIDIEKIAEHVASQLSRHNETGLTIEELCIFFEKSLGGRTIAVNVENALQWLCDPSRVLGYQDENNRYFLTVLGVKSVRAVLPMPMTAGFSQLFRDILTIDPEDHLLKGFRSLDLLIILCLLYDKTPSLRMFTKKLADQVDAWMEANPKRVPVLYSEWIAGQKGASRADEVLGSLGICAEQKAKDKNEWARKKAYKAIFQGIVLSERGLGESAKDIARHWKITNLEGVEEKWRDAFIWLLSGLTKLLDLRCFYFHLKEDCDAEKERIQFVKKEFRKMRHITYGLIEEIKYCSALGPVLRSIRRVQSKSKGVSVGIKTIRKLEESGIRTIATEFTNGIKSRLSKSFLDPFREKMTCHP